MLQDDPTWREGTRSTESFVAMVRRWFGAKESPAPAPANVESAQSLSQALQVVADKVAASTGNEAWREAAKKGMPAFTAFLAKSVAASKDAAQAGRALGTAVAAAKQLVAPAPAPPAALPPGAPAANPGIAASQEARGWIDTALKVVDKGVAIAKLIAGTGTDASAGAAKTPLALPPRSDLSAAGASAGAAAAAAAAGTLVPGAPTGEELVAGMPVAADE